MNGGLILLGMPSAPGSMTGGMNGMTVTVKELLKWLLVKILIANGK